MVYSPHCKEEHLGISSIVLSWNRSDLLERTLSSYLATVEEPWDLTIIDNGSDEKTQRVIAKYHQQYPAIKMVLLKENGGGAALNWGLTQGSSELIHFSENDLEYLEGWSRRVRRKFAAFPDLGQLSMFGPVPSDEEVWRNKSCNLLHAGGEIIYAAHGNVGTSSVLRRRVIDQGVRVSNLNQDGFLFPDDGKLSTEVKRLGYIVAWADHYMVRNLGHQIEEFEKRPEYYRRNYQSKQFLGEDEWLLRIREKKSRPKPDRKSHLLPDQMICAEKSAISDECPEPFLWSMIDGWTAEVETLEFIHGLVRLIKPVNVVETGTWHGFSAYAIGLALRQNGRGKLISLEIDPESWQVAYSRIEAAGLAEHVEVLCESSTEYIPQHNIDLLLLDSAIEIRGKEFYRFLPMLNPGAIVIFHDTSQKHGRVRRDVMRIIDDNVLQGLLIPTPRGIAVCQYVGGNKAKSVTAQRRSKAAIAKSVLEAPPTTFGMRWQARIKDTIMSTLRNLRNALRS